MILNIKNTNEQKNHTAKSFFVLEKNPLQISDYATGDYGSKSPYGSMSSQEYPVNAGIPWGSILGLTFFLQYINGLPVAVIYDVDPLF